MAKERAGFLEGCREERRRREGRRRRSSTSWRSSPRTASTSRTPPPTASSPSRPRGSRRTTRSSSWPRSSRARRRTPTRSCCTSPRRARAGIEVLPPDVNESVAAFGAFPPAERSRRRPPARGRRAAKGQASASASAPCRASASAAVEAILEARKEGGPFKSLFDFAARVDAQKINKKVVEALVKSGALDFEGVPRWQLFAGDRRRVRRGRVRAGGPRLGPGEPLRRAHRRAGGAEAALPEGRATTSASSPSRSGRSACGSRFEKEALGLLPHRPPAAGLREGGPALRVRRPAPRSRTKRHGDKVTRRGRRRRRCASG